MLPLFLLAAAVLTAVVWGSVRLFGATMRRKMKVLLVYSALPAVTAALIPWGVKFVSAPNVACLIIREAGYESWFPDLRACKETFVPTGIGIWFKNGAYEQQLVFRSYKRGGWVFFPYLLYRAICIAEKKMGEGTFPRFVYDA